MKNVLLPPSGKFNQPIHKLLFFIAVLLLNFQLAKAGPNVQASIINVDNPDYCSSAEVTVGITPSWVPTTYDNFYIVSAKLYVQEVKSGGLAQDKLIASAGTQSPFQTSVTFPSVYGLGYIKTEITVYVEDEEDPSESGTYTFTSEYSSSPYLLAAADPEITAFGIGELGSSPYELEGCKSSTYDLAISTSHTFGDIAAPTATFEIFETTSCSGSNGATKLSMSFDENDPSDPFMGGFISQVDAAFKNFVYNNIGYYRVRFTLGDGYCQGGDMKEFCIYITNTPSNIDFLLTACSPDVWNPLPPNPPSHSKTNPNIVGGKTAAINGNMSSGAFSYFRLKLEIQNSLGFFDIVPLFPQYGTNQPVNPNSNSQGFTNISGGINGLIQTDAQGNSPYFIDDNPGVLYKITLYLGSDCGEESEYSYFKTYTTDNCHNKSSEASAPTPTEDDSEIVIYPQPASDLLKVECTSHEGLKYQMLNLAGKTITNGPLTDSETIINISSFQSGVYFLRLYYPNGEIVETKKILIQ